MNDYDFVKFVQESQLSDEDKDLWELVFATSDEDEIEDFKIFIEDISSDDDEDEGRFENLKVLTENLKMKIKAIETHDKDLADSIIKSEKDILDKI
ncbi:MAG: hypothetical protein COV29_01125 [Candidatus Yanofskybacteria bacterium CG10_big_fil_rev_8_21_14_0_10_36_16]|uniref:Uncharacterized protein n=1 Tax=Candidatus Yanofskybacteria bacterium CG10_big_fil_rev_8_21_14_0_10_36_16 TaxID=1975096 RepID=A0A2J0Q861_9BACT|nr:MAG: hypothetical protein COV29_01125 [Candidatus Yanofskybacteria bacterium CG10_big_fil_rev_8_21_14_0_10_36_16]